MNLKNLLAKLSLVVVLLFMFGANAMAQTYVSNTNGNDVTGDGKDVGAGIPYKTIATAILNTADGGTIIIDADTYNEGAAVLDLTDGGGATAKNLTFVARAFNGLTTVTITNGVEVGNAKTINLGVTGEKFNLGTTATALKLTAGTLNITSANVVVGSGGTITRTAGTISSTPTTTNVNVTYDGTVDITAGPELPASLGTGTLTVGITAAKTLTATSALSFTSAGKIVVNTGNATFGAVTFAFAAAPAANPIYVTNTGNTVTFNGDVTFSSTIGAVSGIELLNDDTGSLVFAGSIVNNTSSGTSKITIALTNNTAGSGTIKLAGGSVNGVVTNTAGKTIELTGSATFSGATITNAGTIKLGGNQLNLTGTTAFANTGNVISTTASTVGSGLLNISGAVTLSAASVGELPNVAVSGQLVLTAAPITVPVYGTFTLNSSTAGALTLNDNTLEIWGSSFTRSDNTVGNVVAGTGVLSFRGALAQSFTPGASLTLYDMLLNKTAGVAVTLGASVAVGNDLTITSGTLNVGDYNINLTGTGTFDNSGQAYSSSGLGYVAFQGASGTIQGTGQFGNILVNLSVPANKVVTGSSILFSGILFLNQGDFDVAAGAHTLTMNNALVANPTVKVNTTAANSAALTNSGVGTITYSANVNLYYFGASSYNASATFEWAGFPTKINDVTVAVDGGLTVTGVNAASTIYGTLTVNGNTTLAQGANVYTLAGDGKTHSIVGSVTGGTLTVTGTNSAVNGTTSTTAGYNASVNNLLFEPAANGATFSSTNLKTIGGNLTLVGTSTKTGSSATITMNPTTSTLSGNLAVGAGAATTAAVTIKGTTTSVLTGNVTLTAGTLTLTRGGNSTVIGGTLTATAGTLILGSDISVTGQTTHAAGNIDAGGFTYTQLGSAATPDYNRTGAGTFTNGTLSLNSTAAAIDLTPGATFSVPNLSSVGTANGSTINAAMTVSNSLLLDNAATFAQTGILTVSGNTVTVTSDAGAFTGALTLTGDAATVSLSQSYTIPTLVINSAGTVTVASNNTTARTLSTTAFTNTAGTLAMGINHLTIGGLFTYTAGAITQSTGILTWNGTQALPASGFAIDNLTITAAANTGTSAFTVNKALVLSNTLTTSADGKLTVGDGATIERTANAATLSQKPTFSGMVNLKYNAAATNVAVASNTLADPSVITTGAAHGLVVGQIVKMNVGGTNADSWDGQYAYVATAPTATTLTLKTFAGANVAATVANEFTSLDASTVITTAKEVPSTNIITNVTLTTYSRTVLANNITVNGTLSLANMLDATTTASVKITMADNSTLELKVPGTLALDEDLTVANAINIVYNGAVLTTTRELGSVTSGAYTTKAGNLTFKSNILLANALTSSGNVTFDGGNFDLNGKNFTVEGNVSVTTNGGFFTATTAAFMNLAGTANTTLTLNGATAVPANVKVKLNKTNNTNTITLAGGNLDFATNSATLYFANGVLLTGANSVILKHTNAGGQPSQGFDRTGVTGTNVSHVSGNVKKLLNVVGNANAAVDLTRVEFPVGTAPASPAYYRPMAFQFNTLPTSNVNLTVSEVDASPAGTNGFPLTSGTLTITNYPDFYWLVKSDVTLQPQVKYDIEASAEGYTDYQTDGIQNIRFIRRFDNNTDNPWIVQGGSGYDNSTNVTTPVVVVRSAEGAISTQGARFTYSQLNKAPVLSHPADVAKNEGETVTIAWTATDPDIGQTATVAVVSKPAAATFDATTKTLTWVTGYSDAGTHSIIVSATDGVLTSYDTVSVVITNTNRAPSFTATGANVLPNTTLKSSEKINFTYLAIDPDGTTPTYSMVSVTTTPVRAFAGTYSLTPTGVFEFIPAFGDANTAWVVKVAATDGTASDTTTATVTVGYPVAKGDVNADGSVDQADAAMVLKNVVDPTNNPFDAQKNWAADVNNNGAGDNVVGAYDAALILYYYTNGNFSGAKSSAVAGLVDFGQIQSQNGVVNMPLNIAATTGVLSVYAEIDINEGVEVEGVTSRLPEGWSMYNNVANNKIKIAMAGTTPLNEGTIAVLSLKLKNKEAAVNIQASANLNDQLNSSLSANVREIPSEFALSQNYPNPFNPTTTIKFAVAEKAPVTLNIYNMLGQKVKSLVDSEQEAGYYTVNWDGTNDFGSRVASGIYIYRITAGKFTSTMKMNLLK